MLEPKLLQFPKKYRKKNLYNLEFQIQGTGGCRIIVEYLSPLNSSIECLVSAHIREPELSAHKFDQSLIERNDVYRELAE